MSARPGTRDVTGDCRKSIFFICFQLFPGWPLCAEVPPDSPKFLSVLTERHSVQHPGVGRRADALVDDADAILHGAFADVVVQTHDEKGHKHTVDQVLGQAHQNSHPVPGQVSARTPEGHMKFR